MSNIIKTKQLGLAAFLDINNCQLVGFESDYFIYETSSEETLRDWEIKYMNSCCARHDAAILRLRKFKK